MKMWSTNIVIMLIVSLGSFFFYPDDTKCVKSIHNRPQVISLIQCWNVAKKIYNFYINITTTTFIIFGNLDNNVVNSSIVRFILLFGIPCSCEVFAAALYRRIRTYIRRFIRSKLNVLHFIFASLLSFWYFF